MAPMAHTSLPLSGQFSARATRPERACSTRVQPLDTAEPPKQSRNMLLSDAPIFGSGSRLEAADCSSRLTQAEDNILESASVYVSDSDGLLRANLAGSVSGWLDNLNSAGMW